MYPYVVILAAGRGTRLRAQSGNLPKPLIHVQGEPLLQRTLRQLHEIGLRNFIVVTGYRKDAVEQCIQDSYPNVSLIHNNQYEQDKNIWSTLLGLSAVPENRSVLLVEGDVIIADASLEVLRTLRQSPVSVWTACGHFLPRHAGGIIKAHTSPMLSSSPEECRNAGIYHAIHEITYSLYEPELADWYKNLGIIYIASAQRPIFAQMLRTYAERSLDCYYMTPWAEHLDKLPSDMLDLTETGGASFNTPEEFAAALRLLQLTPKETDQSILPVTFIDIASLRHIEAYDPQRVEWLTAKIRQEGVWTTPLAIDEQHHAVMDGQHRMEAARKLGLRRVPAVLFNYQDVPVRSLRPDTHTVTPEEIVTRALSGNIYPYKTAKHDLPQERLVCHIELDKLMREE